MTNLWVTPDELEAPYNASLNAYDACKSASNILWALSGRKFSGITTVTENYVCPIPAYRSAGDVYPFQPLLIDGEMTNVLAIDAVDSYLSDPSSPGRRVFLRGRKVIRIHTLRDRAGKIIDPDTYYLVNHSAIQMTPNASWNPCDVEVTYTYGTPPPTAGKFAAKLLATEFVKLWDGDDTCTLPDRVSSVTRQGVSYTILDNQDYVDDLRTGIYAIDLFLKSVNPDRARAKARVFSVDRPRARRIVPREAKVASSNRDLFVRPTGGSVTLTRSIVDPANMFGDLSWTPHVEISSWNDEVSADLAAPIELTSTTAKITATYDETFAVLGKYDPGLYTVYFTKPTPGNPDVLQVSTLFSANIFIQLGEIVAPIYTP
jgi:hypothetical protein